jgi:hypothetical protein
MKRQLKLDVNGEKKLEKELNTNSLLIDIRKEELLDDISFTYIFLDDEDNEIEKNKENDTKLKDIFDGKNLQLKKEIIKR